MRRTVTPVLALVSGCLAAPDEATESTEQQITGYAAVGHITPYSGAPKVFDLACPAGTVGTQAGYGADDGMTGLTAIAVTTTPSIDGSIWTFRGTEHTGSPSWSLTGRVICVAPPAGYELVTTSSPLSATQTRQLQLACPVGKQAIGVGFATLDAAGAPVVGRLTYSMPSWDGTSWLINARAFGAGSWELRGTIVCAEPVDLPGYEIVTTPGALQPYLHDRVVTRCSGVMLAGGWAALDDTSAILEGTAYFDFRGGRRFGSETRAARADGNATPWKLDGRAICSN